MSTQLNGSLLKALEILDLFSTEQPVLSAGIVADRLGMPVQTAHRFLLTLDHAGLVVSPQRGRFTLGQKLEELGKLAFEISPMPSLARPVVEGLSRELNESVMACRMGRQGVTCIASAASRRPIRVSVEVGTVLPLRLTAQGKLFLAEMSAPERLVRARDEARRLGLTLDAAAIAAMERAAADIRAGGVATNAGENESEIGAVAVPVRDGEGRVVLTLSVFGILSRFDETLQTRAEARLRAGAAQIEVLLRARAQMRRPRPGGEAAARPGSDPDRLPQPVR